MKKALIILLSIFTISSTTFAYDFFYDVGEGYRFDDVKQGTYYYDAVFGVASLGVLRGYENFDFGPDDPVTRAQLATTVWRYHQHIKALNEEVEYLKTIVCSGIEQNISEENTYETAYQEICFPKKPWEDAVIID